VSRPASAWALWLPLLPDALTCAFFVVVWADPLVFGPLSVRTAMLTMLLEFYLVHATGFFTVFANDRRGSKWKRIGAMAGLSLFYVLMIGAFALSFDEWWPLLAFGWLLAGKVAFVWTSRPDPGDPDGSEATGRGMAAWAGSVVLFLGGVVYTSIAELPRWGMTAALQPRFGLDMASEGLWESQPHRVVAFGALYFGALFLAKLAFAAGKTAGPALRSAISGIRRPGTNRRDEP
jgi:hypothetical protein